jgi:hypothetical protein
MLVDDWTERDRGELRRSYRGRLQMRIYERTSNFLGQIINKSYRACRACSLGRTRVSLSFAHALAIACLSLRVGVAVALAAGLRDVLVST